MTQASMPIDAQRLLGLDPLSQFVRDYFQRLPYSGRCGAAAAALADWERVAGLVTREGADVMICRQNARLAGDPPRSAAAVRRLFDEGYTLLVRHAERHDAELAALADSFRLQFAAEVNIHVYATPAGQFGFGWHYDAEEVFIVQTAGRKEYALRKNTVDPWPLEETLPADMHYEREIMPLWKCELGPGNWLYVPSGYWHKAEARETSISLAIGIQPRAAIDVLDFLRRQLLQSLLWRQRLPVTGVASPHSPEELREELARQMQDWGRDLARRFADPGLARDFLKSAGDRPAA